MADETAERACSFCGKLASKAALLIAGPAGFHICDGCVGLCRLIVLEKTDPVALANLRIAAFAALKGWGSTGPDGAWRSWDWQALEARAERLVIWSLREMKAAA